MTFFHATVTARRAKLKIDGDWCGDKSIIHDHAINYFKSQLFAEPCGDPSDLIEVIIKLIDSHNNDLLLPPPPCEKVKDTVFSMCAYSALAWMDSLHTFIHIVGT